MKLAFLCVLFPLFASASENLITCQLQNFENCKSCKTRIPASCEYNAFMGSLEVQLKPKKIQWLISNPKSGTEKIVTADNKNLTLKDLISSKNLKGLAEKQKVKTSSEETISVIAVFFGEKTALYKAQTGKAIAAKMKRKSQARFVASSSDAPVAGAVKRAQNLKEQK